MADREIRTVLDGMSYLECPRWHEGRLYLSDFYTQRVLVLDLDGGGGEPSTVVSVPEQPSGIGWLPDGTMLVVSMRDRRVLRLADAGLDVHADLSNVCDWHANDMVVTPDGGAYVGNFGFDLGSEQPRPTGIAFVEPDGKARRAADGLLFPNGALLDGNTLIVGETYGGRLTEFTVEPDGSWSDKRPFALVPGSAPDGCTLDADGCVWFADALSNRCVRVARGGEIADVVTVDEGLRCFACMLGGDDGRTLAICAAASFDEDRPHDAVVVTTQVDVPHAGLP